MTKEAIARAVARQIRMVAKVDTGDVAASEIKVEPLLADITDKNTKIGVGWSLQERPSGEFLGTRRFALIVTAIAKLPHGMNAAGIEDPKTPPDPRAAYFRLQSVLDNILGLSAVFGPIDDGMAPPATATVRQVIDEGDAGEEVDEHGNLIAAREFTIEFQA